MVLCLLQLPFFFPRQIRNKKLGSQTIEPRKGSGGKTGDFRKKSKRFRKETAEVSSVGEESLIESGSKLNEAARNASC